MTHTVRVCMMYVEGWVEQNEVTVIPEFVDVRLSVATGMLGASDDEWTDFISMFSLAVRHVHYFLISSCPGQMLIHVDGL